MDEAQDRWAWVQVPAGENQGQERQVRVSGERESIEYNYGTSLSAGMVNCILRQSLQPLFLNYN